MVSMSSQTGNNGINSSNISGPIANSITCGQSSSCSNNNKQSSKMSIDHQATLDKGLKMKIKRTKPGTKSSEAKHEIVKATEQQQNGLTVSATCTVNQDDNSGLIPVSNQSASTSSQSSNNNQGSPNLAGNKKSVGNSSNQTNNISSTSSNSSGNNSNNTSLTTNVSQATPQAAKRGSSGHRRDKAREKTSLSTRLGMDKNSPINTDKEQNVKSLCHCIIVENNISACSNSSCIRKTENNTQCLSNSHIGDSTPTIPPGVFTPTTETSSTAIVSSANLLTVSTPVSTQSLSNSGSANAPGPPSKDIITNSGSNPKISSHIAAQLAAAATSNNSANGSCISVSTYTNSDLKSSIPNLSNQVIKQMSPGLISAAVHHKLSVPVLNNKNSSSITSIIGADNSLSISPMENSDSPPAKRAKHMDCNISTTAAVRSKELVDICIGTSVGTITEPDCLGPCEPGTSVTLEGIVWHETEGGVLVVNVTWRGKTYVGTLLDCTRHDWAPPRFCESPTEDLDPRTPKGRGKRGRATITPDLSNFTETRSSIYFSHSHVHSKLRNGPAKGGRGASRTSSVPPMDKINSGSSLSSGNGGSTPSTSPTAFFPPRLEKRKSKDESSLSPVSGDNETVSNNMVNASGILISANVGGDLPNQSQSLINPITGLNVQINTKKCKTSPCAISPVLLECPEQDCSKKYKHVNGLRYHQSHAHGNSSLLDEDSIAETEDQISTPIPSPLSSTPTPSITPNPSESITNTQIATVPQSTVVSQAKGSNIILKDDEILTLQSEHGEKSSISEAATSLPELSKTEFNPAISNTSVSSVGENTISRTSQHGQKKQFDVLTTAAKINMHPIEPDNQEIHQPSSIGNLGILRFVQNETKINNSVGNFADTQEISFESDLKPSISTEKSQQNPNNETYCLNVEMSSKSNEELNQSQNSIVCSSKIVSTTSVIGKSKKNRKSPTFNDCDGIELNIRNISSRDVQSPAYSDISDDSTPVNEEDLIEKQISKNLEMIKKSQEIGTTTGTNPNSQNNTPSTLGNYGVYQFYQKQQFIVPTTVEQQQSGKSNLNTNIGNTLISPPLSQQHSMLEFNSKKDLLSDIMSKTNQSCQETNKDLTRQLSATGSQGNNELSSMESGIFTSTTPSKPVSHFYAYNYMPSNYSFNVDPNYAPNPSTAEDSAKVNRHSGITSNEQQHTTVLYNEDRSKEDFSSNESSKSTILQSVSKQGIKSDNMIKSESIKKEMACTTIQSQMSQHMQLQSKDHQGIGVYSNVYQRHPLTVTSQQLTRDEELRRYYIFSDQQRRQNSSHSALNQVQNASPQSGNQLSKDDMGTSQHNQIKTKSNLSLSIMSKSACAVSVSKGSPKHKQEEELKVIKQEGQKPTMETQGPPPPPTSQYFLHPSYIASAPFGFDPSHPMYRNVLMPTSSPYNTPPYHLPIPRYHAPEDLSRNAGAKALDALHHAASQYYTTHKIHELSERALKSPNNSNSNSISATIKMSGISPNIGTTQHSNISSTVAGHHTLSNQPSGGSQLSHNLTSQAISISNKQDIIVPKSHGSGPAVPTTSINELQKQPSINSSVGTTCNGGSSNSVVNNVSSGSASDSRSPPPQRHVHTHHHTHVGLGYPMYPAPYGAAVLASQQAAAVAVINPFPPGPNK